jgi:hypothetical protein
MERRRFVPESEGLEAKKLLSIFTHTSASNPALDLTPIKNARIERLPGYLQRIEHGRFVPRPIIDSLQSDLHAIESKLTAPPSTVLTQFNFGLRDTIPHASLTIENALQLNHDFGAVLTYSGAPPAIVPKFQADMNELAQVDANDANPAGLTANDYALITQMIEGLGQPIKAPAAPRLAPIDSVPPRVAHTTRNTEPRLVGVYDIGDSIQLLNESGNVIGSTSVATTGRYAVTPATPFAPGTYTLRVRALNPNGNVSLPSAPYSLTVLPPVSTPKKHA